MPSVESFLAECERFRGQPYEFGAEIPTAWDSGHRVGPVDCSELTSVAARRVGVSLPDGAYNQWDYCRSHGTLVPVAQARSTRGALLFYDDGSGTGRDRVVHVAVSLGDGRTFEAWTTGKPVGNYDAHRSRFTTGGLVPGLAYGTQPAPPVSGGEMTAFRNLHETDPRLRGDDVRAAQILLRGWGFDPGSIDGVWGPACTAATRRFQASVGLAQDGQFGPRTRDQANGA